MKYIKYHGIERGCSNVTERYLLDNYSNVESVHKLGWKHAEPKHKAHDPHNIYCTCCEENSEEVSPNLYSAVKNNEVYYLICTKNPFAWLNSYLNALQDGEVLPNHYQRHEGELLMDWIDTDRKYMHHFDDEEYIRAFLHKYNIRHRQWWNFVQNIWDQAKVVRHEDLIMDFREVLNDIEEKFGLARKNDELERINQEIDPNCEKSPYEFDPNYYIEERYMEDLDQDKKEIVSDEIDWEFFASTSYSYKDKFQLNHRNG